MDYKLQNFQKHKILIWKLFGNLELSVEWIEVNIAALALKVFLFHFWSGKFLSFFWALGPNPAEKIQDLRFKPRLPNSLQHI